MGRSVGLGVDLLGGRVGSGGGHDQITVNLVGEGGGRGRRRERARGSGWERRVRRSDPNGL